ncbi:MAG: NUDIX domain-containing protein, partial [Dongiaceae bacterium]
VTFHAPPLMVMERAAVPAFGVRAYGVHLSGHVGSGADLRLWVGRRSHRKPTYPGKLDHLVAGGQPAGLSLGENLLKECAEEASLPPALVGRARPAGVVSYLTATDEGIRNDVLFVYDLELPPDFVPVNSDGEIEEFFLWPIERVRRVLAETDDFKFNVALVIIDFLIRHGLIGPDEPDYLALVDGLRSRPGD